MKYNSNNNSKQVTSVYPYVQQDDTFMSDPVSNKFYEAHFTCCQSKLISKVFCLPTVHPLNTLRKIVILKLITSGCDTSKGVTILVDKPCNKVMLNEIKGYKR